MKITALRAQSLYAELPAPMRSRGSTAFTEFFHTGSEYQRVTVVEVLTDADTRGLTLLGGDARGWLETVAAPALVGADPRAVRHCRRSLCEAVEGAGDGAHRGSRGHVNRLEFALWDLLGKSAGLPLYRLLGGTDPFVDVYAGGGSLCWNPLPLLLRETEELLARGFRALKIKVGHGPAEDAEIVRSIRGVCGPDIRIMVDANRAYDLPGALRFCEALEEQQVYWFEEPFGYDDPSEWQTLRRSTAVLIAGGEGFTHLSQADEAIRHQMLQVLQCDAGGFGLEGLLAIASLAEEGGVRLTPHSCNSVIGFVAACHLQRALPNAEIQEFETFDNPFIHSIFNEPLTLSDGKVRLSEAPGLGVTLNEVTLARCRMAG
jgi:L-alanine-DL-glutamate epimerase-like enolase superfamily enzyme